MSVLTRGNIDVHETKGEYQLLVDVSEPQGHGAVRFAFEQLKEKLAARRACSPLPASRLYRSCPDALAWSPHEPRLWSAT